MRIGKRYRFEAAHRLPNVPDGHKCRALHGHTYRVEVEVEGDLDRRGFVLDFAELDEVVLPLLELVDHATLNDVPGLENPTAEVIALWFLRGIKALPRWTTTCSVRVWENDDCWAEA